MSKDDPQTPEGREANRLSTVWKRYRVVRDNYNGYEAQVWRVWWPFWVMVNGCNTVPSVDMAERLCRVHASQPVKKL